MATAFSMHPAAVLKTLREVMRGRSNHVLLVAGKHTDHKATKITYYSVARSIASPAALRFASNNMYSPTFTPGGKANRISLTSSALSHGPEWHSADTGQTSDQEVCRPNTFHWHQLARLSDHLPARTQYPAIDHTRRRPTVHTAFPQKTRKKTFLGAHSREAKPLESQCQEPKAAPA